MALGKALQGMVAGDFMNIKGTSFAEFTRATSALLPVYAGCLAACLALYGLLRLLGAGDTKKKRA